MEQELPTTSLTVVRIKRRRDEPAEPEIILEAAGDRRSKQPRYDDLLLQFQGMSVVGAAGAIPSGVRQRRFRRLQTVDVSVLEGLTEPQLLQLLCARAATGAASAAPVIDSPGQPASQPGSAQLGSVPPGPAPPQGAAGVGPGSQPASGPSATPAAPAPAAHGYTLGTTHEPGMAGGGQEQAGGVQRRDIRAAEGLSRETRMAVLRDCHRRAGAAARYKQVRRRRDPAAGGDGEEGPGVLHMYDLERLPAQPDAAGPPGRRADVGGRNADARPQRTRSQADRRQQQHPPQQQGEQGVGASVGEEEQRRQQGRQQQQAAGLSATPEELLALQRFGPLVSEYLREHGHEAQKQPHVVRIPARPRRPHPTAAPAQQRPPEQWDQRQRQAPSGPFDAPPLHAPQVPLPPAPAERTSPAPAPALPAALDPHARDSSTSTAGAEPGAAEAASAGSSGESAGAGTAPTRPTKPEGDGGDGGGGGDVGPDTYVYDVYVPVPDEDVEGGGGGGAGEELWPWPDAPSGPDLFAPVIEVAEDDDEFFWAGEVEAEAAQRAAAAEEHDSEDSNAESYYANSYPDEDAPYEYGEYGNDGSEAEMEEAEPADADAGGYSWGAALAMRRGERPSDDDDEDGDWDDEEDDEIFGRRRRRARPVKKASSYYRTEDDDYSEHSSFLSEEEERREAEALRRRTICMH